MKNSIFISSIIGIILGIVITISPVRHSQAVQTVSAVVLNKPTTPETLTIKKLGIEAPIEQVGKDKNNSLGTPSDVNDVGWYSYGFLPGEKGNAVMDGHIDSKSGPAVFYRLNDLHVGDEVQVKDKAGHEYIFTVVRKEIYDFDKVPMKELFKPSSIPKLNLITCTGVFDHEHENYLQRTVIYSELKR